MVGKYKQRISEFRDGLSQIVQTVTLSFTEREVSVQKVRGTGMTDWGFGKNMTYDPDAPG